MNNPESTASRLDRAFANFICHRSNTPKDYKKRLYDIVLHLSFQQNKGHSCLPVNEDDQQLLLNCGLVSEGDRTPLILDRGRLYLHRYWFYECRLARQIIELTREKHDLLKVTEIIDRYFNPILETEAPDWQREAALTATKRSLTIITGGPGTGKTTTVVKILALLQEVAYQPLLIALATPTGKAAMRLQEAICQRKDNLPCAKVILESIPEQVSTLHSLLRAKPFSPYFYYCAERPLPHDLLVVDEASMVDLALMSKLVDALKPGAQLILLGDKDQLASVESGSVLEDLTRAFPECTLELKQSFRFDQEIKQFAKAVNNQNAVQAWEILNSHKANISLISHDAIAFIAAKKTEYLNLINIGSSFNDIYQSFHSFQVLCSNRYGVNGALEMNTLVEKYLIASGCIKKNGQWYSGRPIMITQNNPAMHLYNGDIGICLPSVDQEKKLMVYFLMPDGSVKKHLPTRLPHYETVFAMTVHKSQGSEFDEILISLPPSKNPVLTKELLYTAITRARKKVNIAVEEAIFKQTIQHNTERFGGLVKKIKENQAISLR